MIDVSGIIGKFVSQAFGSSKIPLRLTEYASLAVQQVEPAGLELSRAGVRYAGGCQVVANGVAPVQAIPTTSGALCLYNSEPDGGKSIVVESVSVSLASGTPGTGFALYAGLSQGRLATAPSAASNYGSAPMGKVGGKSSIAVWATTFTLAGSPKWWALIAGKTGGASASVGDGGTRDLAGRVVIPPGHALGFTVMSPAGTSPLFAIHAEWAEVQVTLE